jgi:citrate synthase
MDRPRRPTSPGVTVLESAISSIDASGLRYRGFPIEELVASATFAEVAWLLITGNQPSADELVEAEREIAAGSYVPAAVWETLAALPPDTPPTARMQAALPWLALTVPELREGADGPVLHRALRLLGAFSVLAGSAGHAPPAGAPTRSGLSGRVAQQFLSLARGAAVSDDDVRALEQVLILYADHELNASTFTGRVAASTRADLVSAVLAALSALRGPLHGGVDRYVRSMLAAAEQEGVESVIDRYLRSGTLLPGFGHAVYRGVDPRGVIMRDLARRLAPAAGQAHLLELTEAIERTAARRGLPAFNVDLFTVVVYRALGIPDALSTLVFATGRLAGWCAHILEQYADNRLIRPRAAYIGPPARHWRGRDIPAIDAR